MESARGPLDPFAWFVPLSARGDRRRTARAQAVARALLAISAMTVLLSVVFLFVRGKPSGIELSLLAAGTATPILAAAAIRFTRNPVGILVLTNLVGISYVAVWANATGGTLSVALPWLVALLATLGTFGNTRVLLVALLADAFVLTALYIATSKGLLRPSLVPADEVVTLAYLGQLSALMIIALAAVIVIRARTSAGRIIRQSEQRLRSFIDGVPAAIGYIDYKDGVWRYALVNRRFAARTGRTPDEVVGMSAPDLVGASAFRILEPHLMRVRAGHPAEYDRAFELPDGTTQHDSVYLTPDRGSDGVVRGAYVFGIDDTGRRQALNALRESEAKLADAQAMAHLGNWEYDLPTDRLEWSAEAYRIYGHVPGGITPYLQRDYLAATHPDDRQKVRDAFAHVLATRGPHMIDHRILLPGGVERVVELRAQILRTDAEGNIVRLVGVVQDITERKRDEVELIKAKDAAEAASRSKSAFLSNMSHEIRTPMNGVLGMADLLMQEPLGDKGRRYAQTIQRSGRALLGVLTDVLDLSKIEAGRMELVMTRFYLPGLVREIKDLFSESAQARGVTLTVEVGPEVARWVTGDAVRLRQVMLNLVSNALKFTERGAIEVRARGDEMEMVRFEVKDTGIGIATDMQAAIFNAFAQADESATRRYGGTGLGLSIARELVHLMDGQIGVASAPGAGALFWFRVRLPDAPAPAREGAMAGKALRGRRVLVAEDDAVNAEVTQAMLVRHGIEVVMAEDGAKAVAAHARGRFDLILMDCRMPALDGFEATRRIRDAEAARGTPGTPIVALTAHAMTGYRQQCLDAGMDDYLVKPYVGAAFDAMLGRWLD